MLATVDSSKDKGVWVKYLSSNLATVAQLKDTLTHLCRGTVYLIEKEDNAFITGSV